MRFAVAFIAAAFFSTASAQSNSFLYPSPLGIVLSAGKLIYHSDSNREHLVTVKSIGKTEAEARTNAFQLAVEHVVGQLVLSEREVSNNQVVRNDIIQYSSGYVSRYDVKKREVVGNEQILIIDVYVKQSKIADRLVNHSTDKTRIDSKNLAAQVKTLVDQTRTGDRVLKTILNDYPSKAFSVSNKDVYMERGQHRGLVMVVPVKLVWNHQYVESLGEALITTGEGIDYHNRKHGYRLAARVRGQVFSKTYDVWTEDYRRYNMLNSTFSTVGIKVEVLDSTGNIVTQSCIEPMHELTKFINNQIIVDGTAKLEHVIRIDNINESLVEEMDKITITAVKSCKPMMVAKR
jgi:hypothetical protein